jgi:hypothetical protein
MGEQNAWRWGAYAGIAAVVVGIVGTVIALSGGAPPGITDTSKFADYEAGHVGRALAFAWMGSVAWVLLLPFFVSVRQVIRAARGEWEWAAGVAFAAGVSFAVLVLVHFGLMAAVSIDTTVNGDPAALKALFLAGSVIGSTLEFLPAALLMLTVSYVIQRSGVLPRWTAWVGYVAAALNVISSAGVFGGGNNRGFFTATGFAGFLFGILPFVIWVASVSIAMLRAPEARRVRAA